MSAPTLQLARADEATLRRLAFIKYLYSLGLNQAQLPEPLSSACVLNFHDAIELFLQLASEKVDAPTRTGMDFLEYWDALKDRVDGGIAHKESMRRLNKARVGLKHSGTLLTRFDVAGFSDSATRFFVDNTPRVFGVDLRELSLALLVWNERVRVDLAAAQEASQRGDHSSGLGFAAVAFQRLVDDYAASRRDDYGKEAFGLGPDMTFLSSFHMQLGRSGFVSGSHGSPERRIGELEAKMATFVDAVQKSVRAIQETTRFLALGLDYRRYVRFYALTPEAYLILGSSDYKVADLRRDLTPTRDDVDFCAEFVIESALRLQDPS